MRIVALTGWGQDRDKQRTIDAGFDAHLTKPADPRQLAETLRALKSNT
jgi:CheY-like chemotaxis protein